MPLSKTVVFATAFLSMFAQAAFAETLAPVELAADSGYTEPQVETQAWTLTYDTDAQGNPVQTLTPIADASTAPGVVVLYEVAVINPTDTPLKNIVLNSAFPAEMELQSTTFSGPEGFSADYTVKADETADTYYQIVPAPAEDVKNAQPSVQTIETLRVTVPDVPAKTKVLVTYAGKIRQDTPTSTETEQEMNDE